MKPKIIIPLQNAIHFIDPLQIIFCEADSSYTSIHLTCGHRHFIVKTLAKFSKEVGELDFVRVHQSYLVNKAHIKHIDKPNRLIHVFNDYKIPFTGSVKALVELIVR